MKKQSEHPYKARFPLEQWSQLEQMAEDEERSINWILIEAIREKFARHKKRKVKKDEPIANEEQQEESKQEESKGQEPEVEET
jgi:hypothetical protein